MTVATLINLLKDADPDNIVVIPYQGWTSVEKVEPARLTEITGAGWVARGFIEAPASQALSEKVVSCVKLTF
jgi:hypothetical protein